MTAELGIYALLVALGIGGVAGVIAALGIGAISEQARIKEDSAIGVIFAGLLLALSYIGGESAQVSLGISDKIAKVFQGILLFFILACDTLILYRIRIESGRAAQTRAAG